MSQYQTRPVLVDAVQITEATFDAKHPNREHVPGVAYDPSIRCAVVPTKPRATTATIGDWIVTGADGSFSVCSSDAFDATYEPA